MQQRTQPSLQGAAVKQRRPQLHRHVRRSSAPFASIVCRPAASAHAQQNRAAVSFTAFRQPDSVAGRLVADVQHTSAGWLCKPCLPSPQLIWVHCPCSTLRSLAPCPTSCGPSTATRTGGLALQLHLLGQQYGAQDAVLNKILAHTLPADVMLGGSLCTAHLDPEWAATCCMQRCCLHVPPLSGRQSAAPGHPDTRSGPCAGCRSWQSASSAVTMG